MANSTNENLDNCIDSDSDESFHSIPPFMTISSSLEDYAGLIGGDSFLFESAHSAVHSLDEEDDHKNEDCVLMEEQNYSLVSSESDEKLKGRSKSKVDENMEGDGIKIDPPNILGDEETKQLDVQFVSEQNTNNIGNRNSLQFQWKVISEKTQTKRPKIYSISFNQEKNCVAIGTANGYHIRTIHPSCVGRQVKIFFEEVNGGVYLCEMLHCSSLIAIVKNASPRTLSLLNTSKQIHNKTLIQLSSSLCDINFGAAVRHIEVNRQRLFVLSADAKLHVFDLKTVKLMKSFLVLHPSEPARSLFLQNATTAGAFFDVSKHESECWIACRCSDDVGLVHVYDSNNLRLICKVKAHEHSIARIAIGGSVGEQRLATASQKGSVIRIFSLPKCEKLYTLWRGSNRCSIYSLAFDQAAKRIAVSGSTSTIHFYKLEDDSITEFNHVTETNNSSYNYSKTNIGSMASPSKIIDSAMKATKIWNWPIHQINLFSNKVKDTTESLRSFAKIKLKSEIFIKGSSPSNIIAIRPIIGGEGEDCIFVCTIEGKLQQFKMDRINDTIRLMDIEDLIIDQDDLDECSKGIVL